MEEASVRSQALPIGSLSTPRGGFKDRDDETV